MAYQLKANKNIAVGNWLMVGVVMIIVQVVLGGITRLTESGLSITEWDVVSGILPPLTKAGWLEAFNGYKATDQYKILKEGMTLAQFKWIFFWEYIHRLWARTLGFVFAIPLAYFIIKQQIKREEIFKYLLILVLGGMQGAMGWIMVASGLEDRVFVDPVKLMLHLFLAVILLMLVYRLALENLQPPVVRLYNRSDRRLISALIIFIFIQIGFGALVAGSRAALAFPTWPRMGEVWIPNKLWSMQPIWHNFVENLATIQFMHRMTAYVLVLFVMYVVLRLRSVSAATSFHRARTYLLIGIFVQLMLGIFTVMNSKLRIPVTLGVLHQLGAMIMILIATFMHYTYKYR
ncbi:MAG: COX15/CtaA family protein [Chitinophagales bacterium]